MVEAGCVDVWLIDTAASGAVGDGVLALSANELERAGRYRRRIDAERFVASRSFLRHVLASYTGDAPAAVTFDTVCVFCGGPHGKPRIAGEGRVRPNFSFSRTGAHAAVAVVAMGPIGLDIEGIFPASDLAPAFMSPDERADLARIRPEARSAAVVRCWTRKEALAKATARGLALDPRSFSVTVTLDAAPRVRKAPMEHPEAGSWAIADIAPMEGLCGSVVTSDRARVETRNPVDLGLVLVPT
jgi:4'-phosphopantetheinyl transferase